jgi:2-oxoglutarate dehydrogenase E1 component
MVMPLLISGDAAFAGQDVIAECFGCRPAQPSHQRLGAFSSTTRSASPPIRASRASPYPSDVAKMIEAPIFHANGDDPGGGLPAKVATEFRQKFQVPVVIDMFCYRRFGHNEATSRRSPSR